MSYLALYRKYRPSSFDDVVGQNSVTKVIYNAIINNKVSHAYLFSGPRGTGKTTTAKIIAKMVNCEHLIDGKPCDECESCRNILNSNDVVEIDAASNNGVDEIREIRDKVNLVPTSCKYKVYIIDEVHMLTTQAFNALLKTLEEPPKHVIFILATTEFYKIPLTVMSRCQKFQFTKIDDVDIVTRLEFICKNEGININNDALYEIARLSDGGLRDAINLLDQLTVYQSDIIDLDDVYKICGSVSYLDLSQLIVNVIDNNNEEIISFIENIDKNGKNLSKFIEEIIIFLKDILVYKNTSNLTNIEEKNDKIVMLSKMMDDDVIFYFINSMNDLLIKLKNASYPAILIVVDLLKISNNLKYKGENNVNEVKKLDINLNKLNDNKKNDIKSDIIDNDFDVNSGVDFVNSVNILSEDIIRIRINNTLAGAKKSILLDIKSKWNKISDYLIDDNYSTIAGLLTDVNPVVASSDYIMFECKYDASVDRINQFDSDISNLLNDIFNSYYKIVAVSSERWLNEKNKYLVDRKNGIVYNIIEEDKERKNVEKIDNDVNKLVNLLGEELIEYK